MIRPLGLVTALGLAAAAHGQALNISFSTDPSSPAPAATFGAAAGQAGLWNSVVDFSAPLVDTQGQPTSVLMQSWVCSSYFDNLGQPPGTSADYRALLGVAFYSPATNNGYSTMVGLVVGGLSNGSYTVYVYSYSSAYPQGRTVELSPSSENTTTVSGAAPINTLQAGVTHSVFHASVTSGFMVIEAYSTATTPAFVNALQIVPDAPLPTCTVDQQPASQVVQVSLTATLAASISGDVRSYQWSKDGVDLADVRGISGSATPTLILPQVRPDDAGVYTLRYLCGGFVETASPATLTVVRACGSADFNADGDIGTDADIEAFFRVLAGGHC